MRVISSKDPIPRGNADLPAETTRSDERKSFFLRVNHSEISLVMPGTAASSGATPPCFSKPSPFSHKPPGYSCNPALAR
jgi:hypothetical protein